MPVNKSMMESMKKQYGAKKGKSVYYAVGRSRRLLRRKLRKERRNEKEEMKKKKGKGGGKKC